MKPWPAFYVAGDSVLWVVDGVVRNGDWRPIFNADRSECWAPGSQAELVFRWAASAPWDGHYNDVIDAFEKRSST